MHVSGQGYKQADIVKGTEPTTNLTQPLPQLMDHKAIQFYKSYVIYEKIMMQNTEMQIL